MAGGFVAIRELCLRRGGYCHYDGTMAKMTVRLPDPVLERLRARSRLEGRSLNDATVDAILRGLGEVVTDAPWRALGQLVQSPPSESFDLDVIRRARQSLREAGAGLQKDLDWVRGDDP